MNGVKCDQITDETFKKEASAKRTRSQKFFAEDAPKNTTSDARKALQKSIDNALLDNLKGKVEKKYLGARFSLGKHDAPHSMNF